MPSKFDNLCSLIVENTNKTIREANDTTYGLNPEYNSSGLTGFDKLAADFVEARPATANEIVDIIRQNSENPDDRNAAQEIIRNLIDSGILVPAEAEPQGGEAEAEPDAAALAQEPEVEVEPAAVVQPPQAPEEEVDGTEDDATAVPTPAADSDEENTFARPEVTSGIENTAGGDDELNDDLDDAPVGDLVKKEQANKAKKSQQLSNMMRYLFQKRGKSPEAAEQYIQNAKAKGLI